MSSARVMFIKDIPLIWSLSLLSSICWVSCRLRLRLRLQRVAFYFYGKGYPVRVYTPVTETYPLCHDPPQDRITRICAVLDKPPTFNIRRVWDKEKISVKSACS